MKSAKRSNRGQKKRPLQMQSRMRGDAFEQSTSFICWQRPVPSSLQNHSDRAADLDFHLACGFSCEQIIGEKYVGPKLFSPSQRRQLTSMKPIAGVEIFRTPIRRFNNIDKVQAGTHSQSVSFRFFNDRLWTKNSPHFRQQPCESQFIQVNQRPCIKNTDNHITIPREKRAGYRQGCWPQRVALCKAGGRFSLLPSQHRLRARGTRQSWQVGYNSLEVAEVAPLATGQLSAVGGREVRRATLQSLVSVQSYLQHTRQPPSFQTQFL